MGTFSRQDLLVGKVAYLVLEDGSVYRGESFGTGASCYGEVVFNTSMTGYQEVLTDPSYAGQIVVLTYPLVGNYGINTRDIESGRIQVAGFVVRELCDQPSHGLSTSTLDEYLASNDIPGIQGIDTRSLTRSLRSHGVMMGFIHSDTTDSPSAMVSSSTEETSEAVLARFKEIPSYGDVDFVSRVTASEAYGWDATSEDPQTRYRILVLDMGLKYNILRLLRSRGCEVTAVPATTSAQNMLDLKPDGIVLSPGPGDPALLGYVADNARLLMGRVPILGICLGHQVVARALGGKTYKLKFGHRGANHPVRELLGGRVYITAQNHGYAVDPDSLPPELEVTHINLNDDTIEGLRHRDLPILTVQYHSEASPGPRDNEYLFDTFLEMVDQARR